MRVESIGAMIEWTRDLHGQLAEALSAGHRIQQDERAKWLLEYLRAQESRLGEMVEGFQEQADEKALHTRVYDWEAHTPLEIASLSDKPYGTMTYDAIAEDVLESQTQIIQLYEYLLSRASISEEQELIKALLNMEEHETMQMSQSINRGRDM